MKAAEQYFPVVLFITLHKVILTFESVDEILKCAIQVKTIEQYFPVVQVNFQYLQGEKFHDKVCQICTYSAGKTGASSASSNSSANSISMNSFLMTTCSLNGWVCLTSPVSKSTRVLGRLLVMIPLTGTLNASLELWRAIWVS